MSFLKKSASEPGKVRKASEKAGPGNAKKKDASHYISAKEAREIARSNAKEVRALEKFRKRRNVPESEYLTQMRDENNIVEFEDLHTYFFTDLGVSKAVNGVSFDVPKGKVVGIVGESGCGKSVTSMSLMQLVQAPQGQIVSGSIRFNLGDKAYDIAKMPRSAMCEIRGKQAAMIFQEPMTALNPVFTVGYQIDEVFFLRKEGISKEEAKEIVRMADRRGLIHTVNPGGICSCCTDCCYLFRAAARRGSLGVWPKVTYRVELDKTLCVNCGLCRKRCRFSVFTQSGEVLVAAAGQCQGCGLCVTACPTGALRLRKEEP